MKDFNEYEDMDAYMKAWKKETDRRLWWATVFLWVACVGLVLRAVSIVMMYLE